MAATPRQSSAARPIPARIRQWERKPRSKVSVRLMRRVKLPDGKWDSFPVAVRADGTHEMTKVVIRGQAVIAECGTYHLHFRENGRRRVPSVGEDPAAALAALKQQRAVMELRAQGVAAEDAPAVQRVGAPAGMALSEMLTRWKKSPPLGLAPKSVTSYRGALEDFVDWARRNGVTHVLQVDREVVFRFVSWLTREQKRSAKTALFKRMVVLMTLRDHGAEIKLRRGDTPRVREKKIEIYERADLERLFASLSEELYETFRTLLCTGFRERELAHLDWERDFDAKACTLSVTAKPEQGFEVKNYTERVVRVPEDVVKMLERRRARMEAKRTLIFGTRSDTVDAKLLEKLKRAAWQAGLSCGRCEARERGKMDTCAERPICRQWTLHKFRHTYATWLLREGMDIVTVQRLLGHKDIQSTLKYLHALTPAELAAKIDAAAIGAVTR